MLAAACRPLGGLQILHSRSDAPPDRLAFRLTTACEYLSHVQGHLVCLVAVLPYPGIGCAVDVEVAYHPTRIAEATPP